jgi:hypothetical protein
MSDKNHTTSVHLAPKQTQLTLSFGRGFHDISDKTRLADDVKKQIRDIYAETLNTKQVALRTGINRRRVYQVLRESGIYLYKTPHNFVEKETRDLIAKKFQEGESPSSIAEATGLSKDNVRSILRRAGIRSRSMSESKRKHVLDDAAFDVIDQESAYWIGFLMADGCVSKRAGSSAVISLSLAEIDRGHVEKFRDFLGATNPINVHTKTDHSGRKFNSCRLGVVSEKLAVRLSEFGVVPRKSLTAKVAHLEMDRDFWRGVIDGDGSIFVKNGRNPEIALGGSEQLMIQFKEFASSIVGPITKKIHRRKGSNFWLICFQNSKALAIIEVLYKGCSIALDRKFEVAEAIMRAGYTDGRHKM